MGDEKKSTFLSLLDRSIQTAEETPLDRIFVRDYIQEIEIGAFQRERDVTQSVRFNVVLEIAQNEGAETDDVDQILSYDSITEAISQVLSDERLSLLETLAERIAERVLGNHGAHRVFVRIEKLDRIPGSLGVEIVRSKAEQDRSAADRQNKPDLPQPFVIFLPNRVLHSDRLPLWLEKIAAHSRPSILCLEREQGARNLSENPSAARRIDLLSIEQNAWLLAGKEEYLIVVDSRTELDWALRHGQLSVWAPTRMVLDAVSPPRDATPFGLAQWLAQAFSAHEIRVLEGQSTDTGQARNILTPQDF